MKSSKRSFVFGIVLLAITAIAAADSSKATQYSPEVTAKAAEFNRINQIDLKTLHFVNGWSKVLYTSQERPIDNGRCLILRTIGKSEFVLNQKPELLGDAHYIINLEKVSEKIAREIWGGRPNEDGGITCDLITEFGSHEMDIFHLDMKFADDQLSSYRLRGIGIQKPQWISPSRETPGKFTTPEPPNAFGL
jgi:hypothetical protein